MGPAIFDALDGEHDLNGARRLWVSRPTAQACLPRLLNETALLPGKSTQRTGVLPHSIPWLARAEGIEAEGACFEAVPWQVCAKMRAREWFSRVKAGVDVYVLRTKPKFLAKHVELNIHKS